MRRGRLGWIAALILIVELSGLAALAEYMLPQAKQSLTVLTENWQLQNLDSAPNVSITRDNRKFKWNVELMWLADRINSDSICTGGHEKLMREYMAKIQASERNKPLLIELSSLDGQSFFVSGMWLFDETTSFEHGVKYGSPLFGLTKEQVGAIKTPQEYAQRVSFLSNSNWKTLFRTGTSD